MPPWVLSPIATAELEGILDFRMARWQARGTQEQTGARGRSPASDCPAGAAPRGGPYS